MEKNLSMKTKKKVFIIAEVGINHNGDIYKFARKKWKDGTEYKDKINIDHTHIDYPKFITNIIKKNTKILLKI